MHASEGTIDMQRGKRKRRQNKSIAYRKGKQFLIFQLKKENMKSAWGVQNERCHTKHVRLTNVWRYLQLDNACVPLARSEIRFLCWKKPFASCPVCSIIWIPDDRLRKCLAQSQNWKMTFETKWLAVAPAEFVSLTSLIPNSSLMTIIWTEISVTNLEISSLEESTQKNLLRKKNSEIFFAHVLFIWFFMHMLSEHILCFCAQSSRRCLEKIAKPGYYVQNWKEHGIIS